METAAMQVGVERVISSTVRMSNAKQGAGRAYDVSASVSFEGTQCKSVQDGTVKEPGGGQEIASFSTWDPSGGGLSVGFSTAGRRAAVMDVIDAFMEAVMQSAPAVEESGGDE